MKVVVLGGGIIGVTTAWFLMRDGHEVTVVDRQPAPGLETSFANAGEISPGYSTPWASPGLALKALKWMFMRHAPLVLHANADANQYVWMAKLLQNCNPERYKVNKARMMRVAQYSQQVMRDLRAEVGLEYDNRSLGLLQVFRSQAQLDAAATDTAVLDEYGVPYEILDAAGCIEAEGGLRYASAKFAGGLRLLGDETGDCFKFTQQLAEAAAAGGVQFHYDTHIENIHVWRDNIVALETNRDKITGDAFVAALGSYSPILLKQIGIKLPILPVKGYSLTIPITEQIGAPQSTVMDETHKVAITRLGGNIRVAGMAELAGYDLALRDRRRETLERVVSDLFPRGGNPKDSSFWCGLRSMTPDSVPILGATPLRNLHLNTGHGTLGWTMSCGSARVVADLISGRTPDIDMDGLTIDRFGARARA